MLRKYVVLTAALLLCFCRSQETWGQVWDGGGPGDNWSFLQNWSPDAPLPNNGSANVVFGGITRLTPFVDVPWTINSLTFNSTAGPFNIGGNQLIIGAGGITNNDLDLQIINTPISLGLPQTWNT